MNNFVNVADSVGSGGFRIAHRLKRLLANFYDRHFVLPPHRGVRPLYWCGLEIPLYVLPLFFYYNRRALLRFYQLRLRGLNPAVVLYLNEADGRFTRAAQLSAERTDMVLFKLHKHLLGAELFIFSRGPKRTVGFYDDARMIYMETWNEQNRKDYFSYCLKFVKAFRFVLGRWDLLLGGSNNDRLAVELIGAFQSLGGSAVICEREGTGTDYSYEGEAECFKASQSIQAHYIFTANEKHRQMFNHARLPSVREIKVLGELDTDFWFHWNRQFVRPEYKAWDSYRKKFLFLTFGVRNYIEPYLFPQYPEISWSQLLSDTEDEVFKLACTNPDVLVFYKMGHLEDNNKAFIKKCKDAGLTNVVALDRSFPCEELMLYSDAIIGFQTTALFEALFTQKPVLFLKWAIPDCIDQKTQMLPIDRLDAVDVAHSKSELADWIRRWLEDDKSLADMTPERLAARKRTREIMFFDADGRGGEKLVLELERLLKESSFER
ncbi:MAG: hypothetical protein EB078_02115 [Proteobacteria bacterium]|nr:hypothetical protein [Pseudomonadota bacterium]NDC23554.1 hypothetical protein [Pseudomonadota bacterium]NDD03677.1 hypothetical protein [Pseudomonadota bacterium]NDG26219.1 hypothetical protein [Pseudomonadota bacterium]